jgi:hypothetical protein
MLYLWLQHTCSSSSIIIDAMACVRMICLLPHKQTPRTYGSFVRVEKRPGYEGGLEDMEVTYLAAASTTEVRRQA